MDISTLVPIFIGLIFLIVIVGLIYAVVSAIAKWHHNNQQSVESVSAQVVAKRIRVSGRSSPNYDGTLTAGRRTTTFYYCTFEDPQGTRREFRVAGSEYGQLVEGDLGTLTYQGSRYKSFQRQ
ncbi:MAG TPA: DUF2500 domain-containing protein [Trichocoleus sp.]